MSRRRFALIVALFAAFAACAVFAVLRVIAPAPAPAQVQPQKPLAPRLAQRVLFVIVDGLRYDVATDPVRMPRFSAVMARETSGEIWAGRISMTTSAILAIGTGQRGRLEQVVRNLSPGPAPHNSWLQNAKSQGLRVSVVGDPAWFQCFGASLSHHRDDPEGVAIDVDFNPQTFRNTRELLALAPDLLIAHFVTPDHQGHTYGVTSERYRAHILAFDRELDALLSGLGPEWTLIVTSDHGASDTGTHGTDVAVQRKSPIYARGPAIRPGIKLTRPLDQLELAALLPTLLGVPAPAHRTGHITSEWLNLPEAGRADVACTNAEQVLSYAAQVAPPAALESARRLARACRSASEPAERTSLAERSLAESDSAVDHSTGLLSPDALPWLGLVVALGLALAFVLAPGLAARSLPALVVVLVATLALVVYVERLPGNWPNGVRAIFFVLGNAGLLVLLVRPARLLSWLERSMPHAPAWAPGFLVFSYPADARPESYAALAVCALVYVLRSPATLSGAIAASAARVDFRALLPVLGGLLALLPVALSVNEGFSHIISNEHARPLAYAALLFGWFVWQRSRAGATLRAALLLAALATVCFTLRVHAGPLLGRSLWVISGLTFLALCLRRGSDATRIANAVSAGVFAFAWLARDFEMLPLLGSVTLAIVVGERVAAAPEGGAEPARPAAALIVQSLFVFALAYALRMGIQDGLEFGGLDFHAGAFSAPDVSATLVGVALAYKYALALLLVLLAFVTRLPVAQQGPFLLAMAACFVARALCLALMFFIAGNSYWTALRVLGDLPTALAMGLGAVLALGTLYPRQPTLAGAASPAARVHRVL